MWSYVKMVYKFNGRLMLIPVVFQVRDRDAHMTLELVLAQIVLDIRLHLA
jgi:hypothetical protein